MSLFLLYYTRKLQNNDISGECEIESPLGSTGRREGKNEWMCVLESACKLQPPAVEMILTLKAPITTAADDIHKFYFIAFQRKLNLMFQVNPLLGRGFT